MKCTGEPRANTRGIVVNEDLHVVTMGEPHGNKYVLLLPWASHMATKTSGDSLKSKTNTSPACHRESRLASAASTAHPPQSNETLAQMHQTHQCCQTTQRRRETKTWAGCAERRPWASTEATAPTASASAPTASASATPGGGRARTWTSALHWPKGPDGQPGTPTQSSPSRIWRGAPQGAQCQTPA